MPRYWGDRRDTALEAPACEESPLSGRPLIIGPGRRVYARQGVQARGIANGAITIDKLDRSVFDLLSGGARSGEALFDGSTTVTIDGTNYAPSSQVYTLTNDVALSTLTIVDARVRAPGVRVFARRVNLKSVAMIDARGDSGNAGSGTTGGTAKSGVLPLVIGGSSAGGAGGTGGSIGTDNDTAGSTGSSAVLSLGGAGGRGGDGQSSTNAGSAGALGGSITFPSAASTYTWDNLTRLAHGTSLVTGGAGGGGGGGGGSSAGVAGGGGGSGAPGGGVLLVVCDVLDISEWDTSNPSSTINADGGEGGTGVVTAAGDGGVGGGGGGGFVQLVYRELIGDYATLEANVTALGGGYGQTGSQTNATVGSTGTVRIIALGQPYVPASEIPGFYRLVRGMVRRARGFIQLSQHDKS